MQNYPCCFGCNSKIRLKRINLYLNRPNRRFILKNRFSNGISANIKCNSIRFNIHFHHFNGDFIRFSRFYPIN